ncbi:MAG: acetoin utilization protein AcuC [Dehalococcoidia bacterium]|nr:acetoin utilization protein AcuC [Dehalococcoidia bacterium]
MTRKAAFVYDDAMSSHVLSETHPMRPVRLRYTYELADAYGLFQPDHSTLVTARAATVEEVTTFHTPEYINAVERVGQGDFSINPMEFNIGPGDNPGYEGMYDAAMLSTGGSMRCVELLLDEGHDVAFNISGGLHHAMPGYAYGFCVFNDPVLAINEMLRRGLRVAYVDIDCHHGDGVQYAFYDTDRVLTISLHETGQFLFPGTGYAQETGTGRGRGYSVNVPLYPYTSDETYYWVFEQVVLPLLDAYRPDVLVSQLGIDSHYRDPITHLALTTQGFGKVVAEFSGKAPKWLALGGGGYDLQAVARSWTLAYGVMSEQNLDDVIPESYRAKYGVETLPDTEQLPDIVHKAQGDAKTFAEASVGAVQGLIFPTHGIRAG